MANNVTLTTDFNVDPYYDDYDETKNYHRVLFRPGYAVQARELTQMQTILQNQIDRFGSHVFKEGSFTEGGAISYDKLRFIRIRDNDSAAANVVVGNFANTIISGGTGAAKAYVFSTTANGTEAATPDTKTLFVRYTDGGTDNATSEFALAEKLTVDANTAITCNVISSGAFGNASLLTIGEGIIYAKDHFIRVAEQTIIINKYSANVSAEVGYTITESNKTDTDDATLLDGASGSYNYAAPGAHRLKLDPVLRTLTYGTANTDFISILSIKNGVIQRKADKTQYNILGDNIARRTFDESGHYIVQGNKVRIREHLDNGTNNGWKTAANSGNNSQLAIQVEPGKAYIYGYEIDKLVSSTIAVDKGNDSVEVEQVSIPSNYGNYINIREVLGDWDVDSHDVISLRDTAATAISNGDFSSTSAVGAEVGTARVRAVEYSSGTIGAYSGVYKLYLYDIKMTSGEFPSIRSVYLNNATNADCKADTVLVSANTVINETSFNRAVYKTGVNDTKRIRDSANSIDTNFNFFKSFDVTVATDGTFTVATGAADEQWPYSTGALNATQKQDMSVVLNASTNASSVLTGTVTVTANTFTGSGTAFDTEMSVGDRFNVNNYSNTFTVAVINSATDMDTLETTGGISSGHTLVKKFEIGQVMNLGSKGSDAASRTVTVSSSTSTVFDLQEPLTSTISATAIVQLTKVDGQEAAKSVIRDRLVILNTTTSYANTVGPWGLGLSDGLRLVSVRKKSSAFAAVLEGANVTSDFLLDTGMRDNHYDHAKLKLKSSSTLTITSGDHLLVQFDHFTHSAASGVGYFSVDSYPVDDVNGAANTSGIVTQEIPIYTSPTDDAQFKLRDCVDIRPRITDVANSVSTLTNISINPANSAVIIEPSGGLHFSPPNDNFLMDMSYYLGRRDTISMNQHGQVRAHKGVASATPIPPVPDEDRVNLGTLIVTPYPSMPFDTAEAYDRLDSITTFRPKSNRRYTMNNIGVLAQRIENLEYYTSLSLLELDAEKMFYADSAGLNRFKNGFLVDNFTGHNVGDVFNTDYNCSIDPIEGELRPLFEMDNVQLKYNAAASSGVQVAQDDVRLTVGAGTYSNGETITAGAVTGTLRYQVGTRLYIESPSASFTVGVSAVGGTSGTSATISAIKDYSDDESKLVTLPYAHQVLFDQPSATTTRIVSGGGLVYQWKGTTSIDPAADYWVDTTVRPEVNINLDLSSIYDGFRFLADNNPGWFAQWGDWRTSSSSSTSAQRNGGGTLSTTSTTTTNTRSGTSIEPTLGEMVNVDLGNSLQDVNLQPFMRSRVIQVTANGMKPNTRHYVFFDGTDVSSYCTPANSTFGNTALEGRSLVSTSTGAFYTQFRLPSSTTLRFRTGQRKLRITDNSVNSSALGLVSSAAETEYSSTGIDTISQGSILSTREISFVPGPTITETNSTTSSSSSFQQNSGNNGDDDDNGVGANATDGDGGQPAQSFVVDTANQLVKTGPGIFVTKVDVFLKTKDSSVPISYRIYEMSETSFLISTKIVPFSEGLVLPADINISNDGSSPTPIVFETPVYLQNGKEYAFDIGSPSPDYRFFVAKLGNNDLLTGKPVVKQPHNGVLFISSNDRTPQALQDEDMKLKVYVADFTEDTNGTSLFYNKDIEYLSVANVSSAFSTVGDTLVGDTVLTLTSQPSQNVGEFVHSSTANGAIRAVSSNTFTINGANTASLFSTGQTIQFYNANNIGIGSSAIIHSVSTPNAEVILYDAVNTSNTNMHLDDSSGNYNANSFIKGLTTGNSARILTIRDISVDVVNPAVSHIIPAGCQITPSLKMASSTSALESAFTGIDLNEDTALTATKYVLSKSNEVDNISSSKSVQLKMILRSNNRNVSPVVDNDLASIHLVNNKINNLVTGEASTSGGDSLTKYMTRTTTLADGQESEDIKVILGAYKPGTATITVYYKLLHEVDDATMEDVSWTAMGQVTSTLEVSDSENRSDFKEYEYKIPTAKLTGTNGEVQYTNHNSITFTGFKKFKIKIVLTSSNTFNPPRVRDMRVIALQV